MNAFTRALASVGLWAAETPDTSPDPFDGRYWGGASMQSMSGQAVTSDGALQLDVVQAVLDRLAGTISTLPMQVFRRTGDDTREPATDHPLYDVLHRRPNARQTAQLFRDDQQRQLGWYRNCLSLILPAADGGPVGSLEPINWARVNRVYEGTDGRVYYEVRRLGVSAGYDTYRDDQVWHIKKAPLSADGLVGMPVYQTSRETLGDAMAVRQFGALYFANGGSGGGVLKHPGRFKTTDDRDAALAAWRSGGSGLNRHKDRLLQDGLDYTPFKVDNDEAQFIDTLKAAELKVCRIWNMPPHMAGILDSSNRSTTEQQSLEFVMYCIAPYISAWEQSASLDLLVGPDQDEYFVELNVAGLLRGDIKTRYAGYSQGRQWGFLSVNDIRKLENMDSIGPDGDRYLEPVNMSPVGEPAADQTTQNPPTDDENGGKPGKPADSDPSDGVGDPEDDD